jgi:hypothetical protein
MQAFLHSPIFAGKSKNLATSNFPSLTNIRSGKKDFPLTSAYLSVKKKVVLEL